ncbi:MAG: hypothetical protein WC830_01730 [Burkholderiales bacterium]
MRNFSDKADATGFGLLQGKLKYFGPCFPRHILSTSPAWSGSVYFGLPALTNEAPAQLAGLCQGNPDRLRGLLLR